MVSCESFPAPINNRYARVPIWNKSTVVAWVSRAGARFREAPMSALHEFRERDFQTRSDGLIALFYRERGLDIGWDRAMQRHRERWRRLRLWYSRHQAQTGTPHTTSRRSPATGGRRSEIRR
jgi:hypothetical protein